MALGGMGEGKGEGRGGEVFFGVVGFLRLVGARLVGLGATGGRAVWRGLRHGWGFDFHKGMVAWDLYMRGYVTRIGGLL